MLCYASPTMGSLVSSTNKILWSGASSNLWVALVVEWEKNVQTVDLMCKSHQMTSQRRFFNPVDDKALVVTDPMYWSTCL